MQRIVILTERKAREAARRRQAVEALVPVLADTPAHMAAGFYCLDRQRGVK